MTDVQSDWQASAVAITCGFEVTGDPYEGVTGDFDGMGISCGALQWNIGSASLQPMVKAIGKVRVRALMPTLGSTMWEACAAPVARGLEIVRGWQSKAKKLNATAAGELRALMGSPEGRAQQEIRIAAVAASAMGLAEKWHADGGRKVSKRSFCWFFDLVTQNGGLKGFTPGDVASFIKINKPERADDFVCDYLAGVKGAGHAADARRNAALWRELSGDQLELLVLSYLRSGKSRPEYRHVVLNRKGTIAAGEGWVNSGKWDLTARGL